MPVENERRLSAGRRRMCGVVEGQGRQPSKRVREVVRRALVLLALSAAGVVTGRLAVLVLDDSAPVTAPPAARATAPRLSASPSKDRPPAVRAVRRAAAVLHAWDADRAAAYARGDPAALRGLYA